MKQKKFYYDPNLHDLRNGYPVFKDNNRRFCHIWSANKYLRRIKTGEEVVHHVDGDKKNFIPTNLIILSDEDHKKIESKNRKDKNLLIMYEIVVVLSLTILSANTSVWNPNVNLVVGLLLIFAMLIPFYPSLLRRILFGARILRRNKK